MHTTKRLALINLLLYLIFLASLVCALRAISSISIALIITAGITKNYVETGKLLHPNIKNPFLAGCFIFFIIHLIAIGYTENKPEGWSDVRITTGMLFVPLAVCCTSYINTKTRNQLLSSYSVILVVASLYCLFCAFLQYLRGGDSSYFFYHDLVNPIHQHAVYFSVLVFIALVFLLEGLIKNKPVFVKKRTVALILFFSLIIFLLSSKLVMLFFLLYLLLILFKRNTGSRAVITGSLVFIILASTAALLFKNPVSKRFYDALSGDLRIIGQEHFSPADYFNGIQFRLLQWKFTGEVLEENQSWWLGVGTGDAQDCLNKKYISAKMYTGDPARGNRGYLGYNAHNQFLQTLLETGIVGLVVFLTICFMMVRIAWRKKRRELSFIIFLLIAWLFTESVLETQYGVEIFTFFPLLFSLE